MMMKHILTPLMHEEWECCFTIPRLSIMRIELRKGYSALVVNPTPIGHIVDYYGGEVLKIGDGESYMITKPFPNEFRICKIKEKS